MPKNERKNTFGKYTFPDWVPKKTQESIKNFWGQMGRTHENWLKASKCQDERESCYHIYPRGFGMPPYGAYVVYFLRDWRLSKEQNDNVYRIVEGKYIHRWNNMGSIIDKNGVDHCVSTCDYWVRVFPAENDITRFLDNN